MAVTATDGTFRRPGAFLANVLARLGCSGALPSIEPDCGSDAGGTTAMRDGDKWLISDSG